MARSSGSPPRGLARGHEEEVERLVEAVAPGTDPADGPDLVAEVSTARCSRPRSERGARAGLSRARRDARLVERALEIVREAGMPGSR